MKFRPSSHHLQSWPEAAHFPPLAKETPFKDPTSLVGGLQFCHQTCQWVYSIITLEAPQGIKCNLITCFKVLLWKNKGGEHLLALQEAADSSRSEQPRSCFQRDRLLSAPQRWVCKIPGISYSLDHLYSIVYPRGKGWEERGSWLLSRKRR